MSDEQNQDAQEQSELDDIWGAAMAEQGATGDASAEEETTEAAAESAEPSEEAAPTATPADADVFRPLSESKGNEPSLNAAPRELEMVMEIPVTLSVELGRTRLSIRELLDLAKGSIVELEGLAGEPMDIMINGYLIAQGEVVVIEDSYGIRVSDIITPAERLQRLNKR
ncbi:flagellar motor switch protein FliN [Zymobacter palmae]|uniref:Flagellar motor switch protein FliN n=1 Tax=Zymobacter palmae TaxID=33074 RepID=A0A348HFF0_9GAMM|nr:flagellar motor switch protein FliN [Zymobacter palmae]BBG30352.1 flagellar motor switch FliN [Zymobacter palmae]